VAFPITTELIVEQARRLGEGGYRYTARQLYYASCAAADRPPPSTARGLTGCGALLILLAAALLWVHSPPLSASLAGLGVVALVAGLLSAVRARHRVPGSRPLTESYDGFCSGPLRRARLLRPEAFPALLDTFPAPPAQGDAGETVEGRSGDAALVLCDRAETAALLSGNLTHLPGARVVTVDPGGDGAGGLAEAVSGRRVVAVHDADPAGCDLPGRLRRAGAVQVADAGLLPPASDSGLQVIEGAPARVPPGVEADLAAEQVHWLRSGRRMELATLGPREVLARVLAALGVPD
jgi:hypothetical protein